MDKTQFKVGSLDQLMALNESAAKLDTQLDITCKKFEKVCFDNGATELLYSDEISGGKSKKIYFDILLQRTIETTSKTLSGTSKSTCTQSHFSNYAVKSQR